MNLNKDCTATFRCSHQTFPYIIDVVVWFASMTHRVLWKVRHVPLVYHENIPIFQLFQSCLGISNLFHNLDDQVE